MFRTSEAKPLIWDAITVKESPITANVLLIDLLERITFGIL